MSASKGLLLFLLIAGLLALAVWGAKRASYVGSAQYELDQRKEEFDRAGEDMRRGSEMMRRRLGE